MSDLIEGQEEPVFQVFHGTPDETVRNVNQSLKEYVVINWNWSVCDGKVILSALLVSQREVRKAQLAMMGQPMGQVRQ